MACSPTTLLSDSACFQCWSEKRLMAAVAYGWCVYVGGVTPPGGDSRITEEGDTRITEEGDTRIIET